MGGGGGGGGGEIPFDMSQLAPFMPSVFKGPYNAKGAFANQSMLSSKYPWITPPAGQFEGAQPGQFAGAGTDPGMGGGNATLGSVMNGAMMAPDQQQFTMPNQPPPGPQSPGIPPQVTPAPSMGGQFNPMAMSAGQTNAMQPNSLQSILAVLGAGQQPGGGMGGGY